jgi:hypothetical protein
LTHLIRTALGSIMLAGALAACTGTTLPGTVPGLPGSSTAPTASVAPAATTSPASTASMAPTCSRTTPPESEQDVMTADHGKFNGQHITKGWAAAYKTEDDVFDAIDNKDKISDADWPCFAKFYPGAVKVYHDLGGKR